MQSGLWDAGRGQVAELLLLSRGHVVINLTARTTPKDSHPPYHDSQYVPTGPSLSKSRELRGFQQRLNSVF